MNAIELKSTIKSIEPEFTDTDANIGRISLPNQVALYLNNDDYLIDISLTDSILEVNIHAGGDEIKPSNEQIKWLYTYLDELLNNQIELTKMYYEYEQYDNELNWYMQ
jgi:hypothetical protein